VRGFLIVVAMIAVTASGCATPVAATIIIGAMAMDAVDRHNGRDPMAYRAPPPDPSREINAQDCTQPVDYSAGNLLCR
jgi:hypothetical protein